MYSERVNPNFGVSINRYLPGQKLGLGDRRWGRYNGSFQPETHSPESLLHEVELGHAFSAVQGSCQLEHCEMANSSFTAMPDVTRPL